MKKRLLVLIISTVVFPAFAQTGLDNRMGMAGTIQQVSASGYSRAKYSST